MFTAILLTILTSPYIYIVVTDLIFLIKFPKKWSRRFKAFYSIIVTRFRAIVEAIYHRNLHTIKTELFSELEKMESGDPDLKAKGMIRVLEVGCGPGTNFKYYTKNCNVILADTNPYFKKYLQENQSKFPDLNLEKFVLCKGEQHLKDVASGSVDVVVTTSVLCSCKDREILLGEIKRVLRQGGKYFFVEHTSGEKTSFIACLQNFVCPFWYIMFMGCHVTRDHQKALEKAGFSQLNLKRVMVNLNVFLKHFMGPHVVGTAVK